MKEIITINSISELHDFFGLEKPKHPLVSVVRLAKELKDLDIEKFKYSVGLYQISLKDNCPFTITNYGRNSYDYQEGSMVFMAPNQVLEVEKQNVNREDTGWSIVFHPDLIRKSELGKKIGQYSFFEYSSNEALHLSDEERTTVTEIALKIEREFNSNLDAHSQILIISNLELLLNYCVRFYDRQFFTRTNLNQDFVSQFEQVIKEYYKANKQIEFGIPTVQYCGEAMNMSPKYLSDLLRKETGQSTQDHIHQYIIEKAKNQLLNTTESASEIAYALGFEYPQYFSKMFKKKTAMSPNEYRHSIN
ncbi:helix-turn-helix domain-containing protein [Frigoriflavimonas asaccharolytica]|uniref:YesN/AraC family two-component response regulator n=1 Tax=Frigoriflavimonas asaccharolytica TaxID=2735899 RepID=A0A8J8G6M3_9FLAO|nr:helix-turn-helix domain-containing protein [Frigoriflavimonas asaccharolytica]NRS92123.1 YesN/AraC family two-component response regulator [Frigoriflavimonas asaccharolytica]